MKVVAIASGSLVLGACGTHRSLSESHGATHGRPKTPRDMTGMAADGVGIDSAPSAPSAVRPEAQRAEDAADAGSEEPPAPKHDSMSSAGMISQSVPAADGGRHGTSPNGPVTMEDTAAQGGAGAGAMAGAGGYAGVAAAGAGGIAAGASAQAMQSAGALAAGSSESAGSAQAAGMRAHAIRTAR